MQLNAAFRLVRITKCRLSAEMLLLLLAKLIVFFFDDLHVRSLGWND